MIVEENADGAFFLLGLLYNRNKLFQFFFREDIFGKRFIGIPRVWVLFVKADVGVWANKSGYQVTLYVFK